MSNRKELASWQALQVHALQMKNQHMNDLFDASDTRFDDFSIELDPFLLDYSKNIITKYRPK